MRFTLIFVIVFLSTNLFAQDTLYKVYGEVKDFTTSEGVVGATVTWDSGKNGIVVDIDGKFRFDLPSGNYLLTISAVGKKTVKKRIYVNQNTYLTFLLEDDIQQLSEVKVEAKRDVSTLKSASMGVEKMEIINIRKVPALMGEVDVIRTMITIPGVSSIGEGAGGINVRGGSVGQNLVQLDGAPIFYTSHLFGFFSVFNQDIVENVTLYKASIPARYGGKIASVLSIDSKSALSDKWSINGGVGIVASRLSVNIPLIKNKLGVILAGRTTYSNYLLSKAKNPDVKNSSASFYDLNGKIDYRLNEKTLLSGSFYKGGDNFSFNSDTTYSYGNNSGTFQVQKEINELHNLNFQLSYSNNFSSVYGDYSNRSFDLNIENENIGVKLVLGTELKEHYLEYGAEFNHTTINPGTLVPDNDESVIQPVNIADDKGRDFSLFLEDNFEIGQFKFITGLRFSHFQKLGDETLYSYNDGVTKSVMSILDTAYYDQSDVTVNYGGLEPRLSISYLMSNNQSIKLSYQRTRQYMHLIANNVAIIPTDIYKLSNVHIKPQIGDQFSIGFNQNFKKALYKTSVEGYFKKIQNIVDYKDGASLFLNNHLETELIQGVGRAYGIETSFEKTDGKWRGKLSYTYSRALVLSKSEFKEENINNGNYYPSYYDKPHDLTALISYHPTARLSYNFNFTYSAGRPVSLPVSKFEIGQLSIAEFSERNQFRVPDYHRLDINLHYQPHPEDPEDNSSFTFGIYNLYGRKNAFSVFFQDVNGAPPQAYKLAILGIPFPYVTYNFSI